MIKLRLNLTIIIIAHRLNTIKQCDVIYKFDQGQLVGQGSFDELINDKDNFGQTLADD